MAELLDDVTLPEEITGFSSYNPRSALLRVAPGMLGHVGVQSFAQYLRDIGRPVDIQEGTTREFSRVSRNEQVSQTETIVTARRLFDEMVGLQGGGASDIHLVVYGGQGVISCRQNGGMREVRRSSAAAMEALIATIFTMADVSDKSYQPVLTQDAQITDAAKLPPGVASMRIATGPALGGRYMAIRIGYQGKDLKGMTVTERLGMLGWDTGRAELIRRATSRENGLLIMSGPTGSGKSTTLMHIMESMADARPDQRYYTLEDPTEFPMAGGVTQINVGAGGAANAKERSEIYTRALMNILRADPNVVMVGELREYQILTLALEASMTGHMVPTTLHANSAWGILARMENMLRGGSEGVNSWALLGDPSVRLTMFAQRLVPLVCEHCAKPVEHEMLPEEAWARLGGIHPLTKGHGCDECSGEGYAGRTALVEGVVPSAGMYALIREGRPVAARELWKKEGGLTMRDHAIELIHAKNVDAVRAWVTADVEIDEFSGEEREVRAT
jgi:type II secretory ATPase GspE/PulE/Tfp pilus assembly ATPase PilB-like protein